MPGRCVVCNHDDRAAIERAVVSGAAIRATAIRYGVDRSSLGRHYRSHLSPATVAVVTGERVGTVMRRAEQLVDEAEGIMRDAKAQGRASLALSAIREIRESLKLLGTLTGELRPEGSVQVAVVNIAESKEWQETKATLLDALRAFPEARAAVARALLGPGS